MAVLQPAGVASWKHQNVWFTTTIANVKAPSLVEVLSPTAGLDLSCFIDAAWGAFSAEQGKEADERWCGVKFESLSEVEYTVDELVYVTDPQNPLSDTSRASAILAEGQRGFLVFRRGVHMDTELKVGDVVDILAVQLGAATPEKAEKGAPIKNRQTVAVVGSVARDVKMAA